MKAVVYFAAVVSVIALALSLYLLQQANVLGDKQNQIQKSIRFFTGSGDDQPVTMSGGSLLLGNDPTATWTYKESIPPATRDMWLDYTPMPNTNPATGLIEITGTATGDVEFDYRVVRNNATDLNIEIDYGPGTTTAQMLRLSADNTGTKVQARLFTVSFIGTTPKYDVISPKKFLRMLSFLRRHPKNGWNVQQVRVTGVVPQPSTPPLPAGGIIRPKEGDLSILMHYCVAGVPCQ